LAIGLVFFNYRVGVVCLTVLLPWSWSPVIPQAQGFNVITFLTIASAISLVLHRTIGRERMVWPPGEMLWCYLVPIAVAVVIAWPYLPIGAANYPPWLTEKDQLYTPGAFLKSAVIKPMFFVVYAVVLANAVRDSKKPERFLVAFALSALVPALAIINEVFGGVDVTDRKHFLANLGLQVNEYGILLALAAGPLLFICAGRDVKGRVRVAVGVVFGLVTAGLLMTASRSATVALMVIVVTWLVRRGKITDLMFGAVVVAMLVAVVPESAQDRLMMGLDQAEATTANNRNDPLTKGRLAIWAALAPEFFESPLLGKGLSSTAWNSAVTAGRVYVGHPHNMFLALVLDIGILGFAAIAYLYYRFGRTMYRLSTESSISPLLREYFAGALAAYIGMLVSAFTGGYYTPHPDQTYFWYSLGFCFAYWKLGQVTRAAVQRKPYGLGVMKPVQRRNGWDARR
jgi:O-antigen ligase